MVTCLAPVSRDLPLLAAFELAMPDRICGVWLDGAQARVPVPVRLAAPGGWRTLLIGSDLGQLLGVVDAALVDTGNGPVRLSRDELRAARALELLAHGAAELVRLNEHTPESVLSRQPGPAGTRIRYLG
jgi:hypothetical protein